MNKEILPIKSTNVISSIGVAVSMTLKEITDLLDVRHDKAMIKVERMAKDPSFGAMSKMDIAYNASGQTTETCILDKRQSIAVASALNTALLMRVIDRWQELEEANGVPQTYPEALRAYADKCEESALIASERDDAIRTKALIGSKREASSMARASFEKRRADQLEKELGKHVTWKAAKAIDWIPVLFEPSRAMWSQLGKYLKKLTDEMNYQTGKIEDTAFGEVNAYHIDVITEAYKRIKEDKNILSKHRAIQEKAS